jgi:UDP-N-acetylmuramoyl-L-alanyl-D-glutamate--2,6-diaminopimelate ligase
MLLHSLLHQYDPNFDRSALPDLEILGIREDSRLIRTGDLFVARQGTQTDGLKFVESAHARGAVAVVTPRQTPNLPLPQIVLPDPGAASILAHIYHNHPSRRFKVIGVTGTNGKTTTTYLIRHLLNTHAQRCGLIGTVEIDDGANPVEATMTTPGAVEIADLMAAMRGHSCKACAVETSSHALEQGRVAGVHFAAAGFTNLSGDHLDYHGTMPRYAAAKAKLFRMLDQNAVAAVNANEPYSPTMLKDCRAKIIRWGFTHSADYRATDIAINAQGSHFILTTPDGSAEIHTNLIGRYNIENALCAAALVCETMALTVHQVAAGLTNAPSAPGRLQSVRCGQKFAVLVDYAHSDDALENVLSALRPLTRGKLRVVFGCGGDRDRSKRPRMAAVAERLADCVYVTSDNPRTENAAAIIDEILAGFSDPSAKCALVESDRRKAIRKAVADSNDGDILLLAGKGHENYQIVGNIRHHFDDVEEARRALQQPAAAPA